MAKIDELTAVVAVVEQAAASAVAKLGELQGEIGNAGSANDPAIEAATVKLQAVADSLNTAVASASGSSTPTPAPAPTV